MTADGSPACGCAERAAQAAQTGRSEEIAVTEDFDPLRIRPYVTIDTGEMDTPTAAFRTAGPLPPLSQRSATPPPPAAIPYPDHRAPGRRKPFKVVAIGAAVIAVIGTGAFAGGLFTSSDQPEQALADETHADLPSANVVESDATGTSPAASPSPFVSADPTATASAPPPAAPSRPAAPATKKVAPPPTGHRTTDNDNNDAAQPPQAPAAGSSLRPGDSGAAVTDLQHRLAAIWLYHGQSDGQYDQDVENSVRIYQMYRHIEGDPSGVYGPNTRRALESEPRNQNHGQNNDPGQDGHQGNFPGHRR